RRGGSRKTRARSRVRIRRKGELRYGEELAADVGQGTIHPAGIVLKHSEGNDLLAKAAGFRLGVAALHADQREDAASDRAHRLPGDRDLRPGDALHERDHAMMSGISRVRSLVIWSLRKSLRFFRRRS